MTAVYLSVICDHIQWKTSRTKNELCPLNQQIGKSKFLKAITFFFFLLNTQRFFDTLECACLLSKAYIFFTVFLQHCLEMFIKEGITVKEFIFSNSLHYHIYHNLQQFNEKLSLKANILS